MGAMRFDGSGWVEIAIRRRFDGERWTELEGRRRTADGWVDLWSGDSTGGGTGSGSDDDDIIIEVVPGTDGM